MSSFTLISLTLFAFTLSFSANLIFAEKHVLTPIIKLKNGAFLQGRVVEVENQDTEITTKKFDNAYFYEGIKYGRASRFGKATLEPAWSGVYNATHHQFACVQHRYPIESTVTNRGLSTGSSSEDCLYLNLFAPESKPFHGPRAVMVFFYGGSFESGTIFDSVYDGRTLATEGDVIVVTVNYRLSAFGFLYGGPGQMEAPGNAGLYDMILALKWVQDNVAAFGGDPNRVTLFGQSAGSMAASALVLSPLASGLFNRVILQSGVVSSYFGSNSDKVGLEKAKILAEKVGCPTNGSSLVGCLQTKSAQDLLKHASGGMLNGESFVPTYGTELLPLPPVQALKAGKFNKVDLVYGVTRDEGFGFLANIFPAFKYQDNEHKLTTQSAHTIMKLLFQMAGEKDYEEIADFYSNKFLTNKSVTQDVLRKTVAQSFADYHIVCPTVLFGEAVLSKSEMTFTGSTHHFYSYRVMLPTSVGLMGCKGDVVCHGEDLIYVFAIAQQLRGTVFSEKEYSLSRDMIRLWTSFAKSGVPGTVINNKTDILEWKIATSGAGNFYTKHLALDPQKYQMLDNYYKDVCNGFWKSKIFG